MSKKTKEKLLKLGARIAAILQEEGMGELVSINQDEVVIIKPEARAIPNSVGSWDNPRIHT